MTKDTMPLAEAHARLAARFEAECDRLIAWAQEHGPAIARELGLPRSTVMRVLDKALDRQVVILGETMLADAADLELLSDPAAGLDAVPERWRGGGEQ